MVVRSSHPDDAARLLELNRTLDRESRFMLLEPDERTGGVEQQRALLERISASGHQRMLVADAGDRLAGLLVVTAGLFRRNRRTASVVVGVARDFQRRGVARQLFAAGEAWARARGVRRLELTVMADNAAALALYRALGFEREGVRRGALEVNGAVVDEIYMGKLLPGEQE